MKDDGFKGLDFNYFELYEISTDDIQREMHKRLKAEGRRASSKDYEILALLYPQHSEYFQQWASVLAYAGSVEKKGEKQE